MSDISDVLGAGSEKPSSDLDWVWEGYRRALDDGSTPFEAAITVASRVDRLGLAFAAGYSAALQTLIPGVVFPCALCVTESRGTHPRAIETSLRPTEDGSGYSLDGAKTFVTFGNLARTLIIAARVGEQAGGRPKLAVVRIPSDREGVSLQALPPTPFVPEIPHSRVDLRGVSIDATERMGGDGYLEYIKPFRTVEDIHVYASAAAYLLGLGQRTRARRGFLAELVEVLFTLQRLRESAPLDSMTHITLHGISRHLDRLFNSEAFSAIWNAAPAEERERWERDRRLLEVASTAREARFKRAAERHWG
jgi:hypothetical protein